MKHKSTTTIKYQIFNYEQFTLLIGNQVMNSAILSGELGMNPEVRFVSDGTKPVANSFLIFKDFKGNPEKIRISAWGNQATELQKYQQGTSLVLEGRYKVIEVQREGYKEQALELNISKIHNPNGVNA